MRCLLLVVAAVSIACNAFADEGMWLYNNPPRELLKQKYKFEPTQEWLDHLQKASVRFNSGGSGSFISADGLVITNHHVGADALQKFGDPQHNYLRDGFYAKSRAEEKKCVDLELNVLVSIEDVTERVKSAVAGGMSADDAVAARRAVIADIEKESKDKTGLRSDVVTLYQGGAYHLYRFKRYDDVRLVFAPEQQIAFYGGDPDNFEYPRFDLDICIFRAYENGQPAKPESFLKWSAKGIGEGDLVFVSGHPGTTNRQLTVADTEDLRDRGIPRLLKMFYRREALLNSFSERTAENARRAREDLFGVQNNRKRYDGYIATLLDPEVMATFNKREADLRDAMKADAQHPGAVDAYQRIQDAGAEIAKIAPVFNYFEQQANRRPTGVYSRPRAFYSTLFQYARMLVRAADERPKANAERLPELRESSRESYELALFSDEAVYEDYEQLKLADSFTDLAEHFGANHPLVQTVLAGKPPRARAAELVTGTKLKDVAFRKKMYEGGAAALSAAHDPMIDLARAVDTTSRNARKAYEVQDEAKQQAYGDIAAAKFALHGTNIYPDATFTLRLSFGTVAGYEEDGKQVPPFTRFAGLYQRSAEHENKEPFDLPKRWIDRKGKLALNTPYNFVSTPDIIGGSSGSPVVNRDGEFVGIIFDGNIQSLALDTVYTEKQARAVSTDARAIMEALRKVYDAGALADEITGAAKR